MNLHIIVGIVTYGGKFGKGSCPAWLLTGLPVVKRANEEGSTCPCVIAVLQ
jgi:ferredoxin-thioredoxin reductase catalytic subunit